MKQSHLIYCHLNLIYHWPTENRIIASLVQATYLFLHIKHWQLEFILFDKQRSWDLKKAFTFHHLLKFLLSHLNILFQLQIQKITETQPRKKCFLCDFEARLFTNRSWIWTAWNKLRYSTVNPTRSDSKTQKSTITITQLQRHLVTKSHKPLNQLRKITLARVNQYWD